MNKFRGKSCKCISWKLLFTVLVEKLQRKKHSMFSVFAILYLNFLKCTFLNHG